MHTAIPFSTEDLFSHSLRSTIYSCSAGVGRTGTFICIDNVLDQIVKEQVVDIAGVINKMRHQRMKMVQTVVSTIHVVITRLCIIELITSFEGYICGLC